MKYQRIIACILAFLITASRAQAQKGPKGDWLDVRDLETGSIIWVKTERSVNCVFEGATNTELICYRGRPNLSRGGLIEIRFARQNVREVRLEPEPPDARTYMATGAAIGAGTAAVVSAINSRDARAASAVFGGLAGGLFGMVGGGLVGIAVLLFRRSKLIYRR